nr:hypothetical protein CFP56_28118 [Quercus suber]
MAPRRAKSGKSKAASEPEVVFDRSRFLMHITEQNFETLINRHIWGERQINLHEFHPSIPKCPKEVCQPQCSSSKRPQVRSTTRDVPDEDMHGDPTSDVAQDGDNEVDVDTAATTHTSPPPPSVRAMMETFMMTQAAHGQLLNGLIAEVVALRVDFSEYRSAFPPPPPSDS